MAPAAQAVQAAAQPAPPGSSAKGVAIESVNNLLDHLDAAFGAIVEPDSHMQESPSAPPVSAPPGRELREVFASLAANHMRQVREFMIGIKWGEAPRGWVSICTPAVDSLSRAASEMDLSDLCAALEDYRKMLGHAAQASGATITGEERVRIMAAYAELAELMPEAFGLEGERGRREAIIVHSLLQQVPDVPKVIIDKIYAAGLATFDQMFVAKADEISAMTGIGEILASRIVEKFQGYRREIASLGDATRAPERQRLADLAAELRELHQGFERAASGWSEDARTDKKRLRQARTEALLQVRVLLARLGEIDRLGRLERLPFGRKIEELEVYLREVEAMQAPAS